MLEALLFSAIWNITFGSATVPLSPPDETLAQPNMRLALLRQMTTNSSTCSSRSDHIVRRTSAESLEQANFGNKLGLIVCL